MVRNDLARRIDVFDRWIEIQYRIAWKRPLPGQGAALGAESVVAVAHHIFDDAAEEGAELPVIS